MYSSPEKPDYSKTKHLALVLLPYRDFYCIYSREIFDIFKADELQPLYSDTGRPVEIPPNVLVHCLVIQALEDLTDREMARMIVTRIDLKYALHLPLGFRLHFDTLSEFRLRMMKAEEEGKIEKGLIFKKVLDYLKKRGLLDESVQRIDSTKILARGRRMRRFETVQESLKIATEAIERNVSAEELARRSSLKEKIQKIRNKCDGKKMSYKQTDAQQKQKLVEGLEAAKELLDTIEADSDLCNLPEIKLLGTIFNEQTVSGDDDAKDDEQTGGDSNVSGSENQANKSETTEAVKISEVRDNISNPHDPEMRFGAKGSDRWFGAKMQISEAISHEKGKLNFITWVETTAANVNDAEAYDTVLQRRIEIGMRPKKEYVDRGYTSGGNFAITEKAGVELCGLVNGPKDKTFGVERFQLSEDRMKATCPAGKVSEPRYRYYPPDSQTYRDEYKFREEDCGLCPLKEKCTKSKRRVLTIEEYYPYLEAGRKRSKDREFVVEVARKRNGIEGTISQFVRNGGRRSKYFGLIATAFANLLRGCAINVKRLLVYLSGTSPPEEEVQASSAVMQTA